MPANCRHSRRSRSLLCSVNCNGRYGEEETFGSGHVDPFVGQRRTQTEQITSYLSLRSIVHVRKLCAIAKFNLKRLAGRAAPATAQRREPPEKSDGPYFPLLRQVASTKPRSQRWAGSVSRRGCHICETVIASVLTGREKLLTCVGLDLVRPACVALKNEPVTSATRSDALATARAARNPGTTATIVRASPRSARASSTGPIA